MAGFDSEKKACLEMFGSSRGNRDWIYSSQEGQKCKVHGAGGFPFPFSLSPFPPSFKLFVSFPFFSFHSFFLFPSLLRSLLCIGIWGAPVGLGDRPLLVMCEGFGAIVCPWLGYSVLNIQDYKQAAIATSPHFPRGPSLTADRTGGARTGPTATPAGSMGNRGLASPALTVGFWAARGLRSGSPGGVMLYQPQENQLPPRSVCDRIIY